MSEIVTGEHAGPLRRRRPSGEPPPLPRELNKVATAWLMAFLGWASLWAWIFLSDAPAIWITERDLEWMAPVVEHRQSWLTPSMRSLNHLGTHWATPIVGWVTIAVGLLARRLRHVLLLIVSLSLVAAISTVVATRIGRPRPLGVSQLGDWEGFAQPSRPIALFTTALVCAGLTLTPAGTGRRFWVAASVVVVAAFGFAQVYVGVDHPTDVLAGATMAVAFSLVLYRVFAPEIVFPISYDRGNPAHLDVSGARGEAIRASLRDQLGIDVTSVEPVGLKGSAGSTPLHVTQRSGPDLFCKLYARSHLRSDRWYKLGRTLLYGRLEDENRFVSVRRLVQHEDYMLRVLRAAAIDSMEPYGIVEITPDHEYLLVTEFLDEAVEISEIEVTPRLIDAGLEATAQLWEAGIAHRDIKPANIMVTENRVHLIDVAFGEVRPSPWRQAVDLANMMLVLALGSTPELVYERALSKFSADEIAEAFAASRGVTLPSKLRADVRADGRDLMERFRALAPGREPVAVQLWSVRRLALTAWVALITFFLVGVFVGSLQDIGLR